ncbi:hypothetical protein [Brevundimonas nasdae]|uniref:TonB C-terminal domain-containing protein n=1 Tax=Brevundimonas nasdae TaxID=172043 RepID=A0ABX8THJ1_9CAUL|nr:hypothetical protein [Brevundimonas nasdae]QYC10703.1 hypothetical protein KWG56_01405 [Brevundimonas nasdae]QYC13490.1 hypothetical protein KWG63_14960 [Brevundimonas nasdae]
MITTASIGKRLLALTAALGSVFTVGAASAQTEPGAAQPPPAEWLAYAENVTEAVTSWLEADTDAAARMRVRLDSLRRSTDTPTALMEVRIWLAPDGRVARIFGPLPDDAEAAADMTLIAASALLPAPPADMQQPLRVGVQLEPDFVH